MHFFPTVIDQVSSKYSGHIKVIEGFGFKHLSTDNIQHSGGIVSEIWQIVLNKYPIQKHKIWLVLGVAGGSVIKLISNKYSPSQITGIDIDPAIVDLGKKHFGLNKVLNLKIEILDANSYILHRKSKFDYILVDLFGRDSCPDFIYTAKFLQKITSLSHHVFINHLYHTPKAYKDSAKLEKILIKTKINYTTHQVLKNIVFVL